MFRRIGPLRCALAGLLALRPAAATVLADRPLDARLADADAVVLATAPAGASRAAQRIHGRIFTDVAVDVLETLRGDVGPGRLTVRLPGGIVAGIAQRVEGAPVLAAGGAWVLLLHRGDDGFMTVQGFALGALPVTLDAAGAPRVLPPHTEGLTMVRDPRATTSVTTALELPPEGIALSRLRAFARALRR